MKKTKNIILVMAIFCAAGLAVPQQALAQWSVGVSYEIQEETPKNGFGIRVERSLLGPLPVADVRLRGHFSYFSEDDNVLGDVAQYDYGLAGLAGASIGLLKPYVGLGIGSTSYDVEGFENESAFSWSGFIGAEVSPIPMVKPFVEYRFQQVDEPDFAPSSSGRMIFGLSVAF